MEFNEKCSWPQLLGFLQKQDKEINQGRWFAKHVRTNIIKDE